MILIKNRIHLQSDDLKLCDLKAIKLLGRGTFGDVFLVYDESTKFMYALKSVTKDKIRKFELYDNLVLERKIMLQVDHPFIVKMVKSFKDRDRVYFLLEHVQGIDLFDGLRILNNENTKFYSACILMILEHLEEREIIYRDLKPENIMIDSDGYLKLIDFGTAKFIKGRTYTIIGTPHYMAPEVIKGIGYTYSADLWSLGIMIYEFVCGSVPFGSDEDDPILIYQRVIEKNLKYPSYIGSQRSKQIIEKLLDTNPSKRGNSQTLKDSSWFLGLDWDSLLFKLVTPPYKPPIINAEKIFSTLEPKSALEVIQESESKFENFKIKTKPEPLGWDDEF
jgi:cGMP-dependent protein kinase